MCVISNPLISVIVPVYNVESYLEECLDSILSQTYTNIEIIVINDGSSDNSKNIVLNYVEKDNRVAFVDNKNIGLGATRNLGINIAAGDFILFIDSDDYIHEKTVEVLINHIGDSDICMYDALSFEDSSRKFALDKYFTGLTDDYLRQSILKDTYREYLFFYISSCLKLYRTGFIKQSNIIFPEGIYGEDVLFWIRCILATNKIRYIDFVGYYRRYRNNSIMTMGSIKNLKDRADSIPEFFRLSEKQRGLQIKIVIYALDNWMAAYELDDKSLLNHISDVYDGVRLYERIQQLGLPVDLRLRYFLCKYSNRTILRFYWFCFKYFKKVKAACKKPCKEWA